MYLFYFISQFIDSNLMKGSPKNYKYVNCKYESLDEKSILIKCPKTTIKSNQAVKGKNICQNKIMFVYYF